MECKFIKHGITLSYDQVLKPCCEWRTNDQWRNAHHLKQSTWNYEDYKQFCNVTKKLDTVKEININDYCAFVGQFLE